MSIRLALLRRRRDIIVHVLRDGGRLGAFGIVCGLLGGLVAARLIASRLYEVGSFDPATFAAVPFVVALVVLVATYLPARRTARVDPIEALRAE